MSAKQALGPIGNSWKRIHDWLGSHAPKILGNLNPGAHESDINEAETSLGVSMPIDWHEMYANHDGMSNDNNRGNLFHGMQFISLQQVVQAHSKNDTGSAGLPVRAADPGIRREDMYNPRWIALAHDYGDTLIRVDMDPAPGGIAGQVIFTDHADDTVILVAPSVSQFLAHFASDLEAGKYFLNEEALQDGDEFLDCAGETDLVNWHLSPRWKHLAR